MKPPMTLSLLWLFSALMIMPAAVPAETLSNAEFRVKRLEELKLKLVTVAGAWSRSRNLAVDLLDPVASLGGNRDHAMTAEKHFWALADTLMPSLRSEIRKRTAAWRDQYKKVLAQYGEWKRLHNLEERRDSLRELTGETLNPGTPMYTREEIEDGIRKTGAWLKRVRDPQGDVQKSLKAHLISYLLNSVLNESKEAKKTVNKLRARQSRRAPLQPVRQGRIQPFRPFYPHLGRSVTRRSHSHSRVQRGVNVHRKPVVEIRAGTGSRTPVQRTYVRRTPTSGRINVRSTRGRYVPVVKRGRAPVVRRGTVRTSRICIDSRGLRRLCAR